jgi:hypothetical protein
LLPDIDGVPSEHQVGLCGQFGHRVCKYPPAEPGALAREPLEACQHSVSAPR